MKFCDIYNRIIILWPEEILISDGQLTSNDEGYEPTPSSTPSGNVSCFFPTLIRTWNQVEGDMMVWTMFQVFHSKGIELLEAGVSHLNTRNVLPSEIEARYLLNPESEGWEEERLAYEGT